MARQLLVWLVAIALICGCGFISTTNAQDLDEGLLGMGFGGGGWCGGGPYGLGFFNYGNMASQYNLPYYAIFPPVYYSYPVPRTYGWSPFAYPPGTRTPEMLPSVPAATIYNPFVPKGEQPAKNDSVDKTASQPRMYYNPFVKQAIAASDVSVAEATVR